MNKAQLVAAANKEIALGMSPVDAVLHVIVRTVTNGDRVSVTGFGTFEKVDRSARLARNPQTGERVKVKKTAVPRFRPGQGFKDLVSGSKKLPKFGPSVKKAPKGSLTGGKSGMAAPKGSSRARLEAGAAAKAVRDARARAAAAKDITTKASAKAGAL